MTRSAIQAYRGPSRRFRFPWPSSVVVARRGWKAEIMGIQFVSNRCKSLQVTDAFPQSISVERIYHLLERYEPPRASAYTQRQLTSRSY